jgi:chaperone BCS1
MSNCTIPDSVNTTTLSSLSPLSSFEDLTSLIQVFLPFTAFLNLPDWLKLAIIGTVLETARRYLFTAWYNIKDSFFLSVQFDGDDSSFGQSLLHVASVMSPDSLA